MKTSAKPLQNLHFQAKINLRKLLFPLMAVLSLCLCASHAEAHKYDAGVTSIYGSASTNFCAGSVSVLAWVKNYGDSLIDTVTVNMSVNGTLISSSPWGTYLSKDSTGLYTFGSHSFSPGVYKIKVWTSKPNNKTDSVPSNDTAVITDTVYASPTANAGTSTSICPGSSVMLGDSAISGHTYSWTSSPSGFTSSSSHPTVTPSATTTYYVTEKITAGGCSSTASVTVSLKASVTVKTGGSHSICKGSGITLGDSTVANRSYSWSSLPSGFTSTSSHPTVSPTVTTKYYLTETNDSTGCSKTDSITITVDSLPVAHPGRNQSVCAGYSVTIGASAVTGHGYSWSSRPSGFSSTSSNPTVTPYRTTTYILREYITATSCSRIDSVIVTVNPLPTAHAGGNHAICSGSSIMLGDSAVSGHTYSWGSVPSGFSSTSAHPTVSPTVNTTYFVTETNTATGCSSYADTARITVNAVPVAHAGGNHTICAGGYIDIGGTPVSGHSYSWTTRPSGYTSTAYHNRIYPLASATYILFESITSTGCGSTDSSIVTVNPLPVANAGGDHLICQGTSITLGAAAVSGYSYSWTDTSLTPFSTASNPTVTAVHNDIYFVTVTNITTGCVKKDSSIVTVYPLPTADAGTGGTMCTGQTVTIGASAVSGYGYSWSSSPSGFTSSASSASVSPTVSTTYSLTVTNLLTGCTSIDSVKVTVHPRPVASFTIADSVLCISDSLSVGDSSTGATSYWWGFGDDSFSRSSSPAKHHYAKGGSFVVSLEVSNSYGCWDSTAHTVYVDSACVWPGDANHDKVVNMSDLLAIGVAYGDTGRPRNDTTTSWYAHPALNWSGSFSSGANYKHADCNGNGTVDSADTAAIIRNYSDTHLKTDGGSTGNPSDPSLSLSVVKDSVSIQDTLHLTIDLGTAAKPVSEIYGICFTVTFDPENINQAQRIVTDFANGWLGTPDKNMIYLVHDDLANGRLDIGITRTDHKNMSGYGKIGELGIIMPENVGGKKEIRKELYFGIENVKAITATEVAVPLYATGDSTLLYQYKTGVAPSNNNAVQVHVYPNPTNALLHMQAANALISQIRVSNVLGQMIIEQKFTGLSQADLDIASLVPGIYFIDMQTDKGIARVRFVKQN